MIQDVAQLDPESISVISNSLIHLHGNASSMEDIAQTLTDHIFELFREHPDSPSQCSLVRVFKSCSIDELPQMLRDLLPESLDMESRCLALLATTGERAEWNSRYSSHSHRVISLESKEIVDSVPMISNLIRMLGLNINDIVKPNPELNVAGFYPLSVFYVEQSLGSPIIPSQANFVIPYGIRSVVGFGGLLTYSDMFTVIMFFKVPVSREAAALFKNLAEQVHDLLHPFQNSGLIFNDAR